MTQADPASRPGFVATGINGHPSVSFDHLADTSLGRADVLGIPAVSGRTFVLVAKLHNLQYCASMLSPGQVVLTPGFALPAPGW
jgi:hypothetical protein